jgi:hypothetical protein
MTGTIEGTLTLPKDGLSYYRGGRHNLLISIFDDKTWADYNLKIKKGSLCRDRVQLGHSYRLNLPQNSDKIVFKHDIIQSASVLNSFVVFSDCFLEDYQASPPAFTYHVTFLNGNGEHLPQEERHMTTLLTIYLIPIFISLGVYFYKMKIQRQKTSQIHLIQLFIGVAFILVLLSILSQLAHLYQYSNDGMGLKLRYTWLALDFFSEITQVLSELILIFVFISISLFGWLFSVTSSKMSTILQRRHIPLFIIYIILQLYLQYHTRQNETDFNYYFYDYKHWAGFAIIILRIISLSLFLLGIAISTSIITLFIEKLPLLVQFLKKFNLMSSSQLNAAINDGEKVGFLTQNQDSQINTVFTHLTIIGIIWFSILPISIIFSHLFNPSTRRLFVVGLSLTVHLSTLFWFLYSFTFDSLYYKASCLSNMGTVFANTQSTGFWSNKISID